MSVTGLLFLAYLKKNGASSISDCCLFSGVTNANGTGVKDTLERQGYIQTVMGEDRRVRIMRITESGIEIYDRITEMLERATGDF